MPQPAHSAEQSLIIENPGLGVVINEALDTRVLPDRAWADARNVRFFANQQKLKKMDSFAQLDSTPNGEHVRQLMRHVSLIGAETLVRVTLTEAYQGQDPPTSIGAGLTGSKTDVITWDQYEDLLIWTDGVDNVKKWDGVAGTFSDLGGSPPKSNIVRVFKGHVILLNHPNFPFRYTYSATGTAETFTGATSGDADLLETQGGIVAAEVLGDFLFVFKENSIFRVSFVGLPDNFVNEVVPAEDGTVSERSVIRVGDFLYYMGFRDFYRISSVPEAIGEPIYDKVLEVADMSRRGEFHAFHRPQFNEIHWKVYSKDAGDDADISFVYNYKENTWTINDYDASTSFISVNLPQGTDTWDGGPATTWDGGSSVSWDDPSTTLAREAGLFSRSDATVQRYDGASEPTSDGAFIAYVESKFFNLDSLTPIRLLRIPLIAKGTGNLKVKIKSFDDEREEASTPFETLATIDLASGRKPWVDTRRWGRFHQVRFENDSPNDDYELEMYGAKFIPGRGIR